MEELLNKLIEKGFRPFGRYDKLMGSGRFGSRQFVKFGMFPEEEFTLRELVSINSGLWQFVCKNGMTKKKIEYWEKFTGTQMLRYTDDYVGSMYQYYLLESALCDENKLEQFLLENIKVE